MGTVGQNQDLENACDISIVIIERQQSVVEMSCHLGRSHGNKDATTLTAVVC